MDNLTNNKINNLGYSLYSINKYAKNCRDGVYQTKKMSIEDEEQEMKYLYKIKEMVLKHFKPVQIHKQKMTLFNKEVIYEGESEYSSVKGKAKLQPNWETGFYKKYKTKKYITHKTQYYLYYEIGGFKFHIPVDKEEISDYQGLSTKVLPKNFIMSGESPSLLMDKNEAVKNLLEFLKNKQA